MDPNQQVSVWRGQNQLRRLRMAELTPHIFGSAFHSQDTDQEQFPHRKREILIITLESIPVSYNQKNSILLVSASECGTLKVFDLGAKTPELFSKQILDQSYILQIVKLKQNE